MRKRSVGRGARTTVVVAVAGLGVALAGVPAAAATSPQPHPDGAPSASVATAALPPKSTPAPPLFPQAGARWSRSGAGEVGTYGREMERVPGSSQPYGVRVWQELLTEHGFPTVVDGIYGRRTTASVKRFQRTRPHLSVTGRVDFATARALLAATIQREADRVGMPAGLLCGHLAVESLLDPQAVNANGRDLGLAQINIGRWNPGVTPDQAFDEDFAIGYMADRDAGAFRRYGDWRMAVYDYNWPADARLWKSTGQPSSRGAAYSAYVMRGCEGPEFPGSPLSS